MCCFNSRYENFKRNPFKNAIEVLYAQNCAQKVMHWILEESRGEQTGAEAQVFETFNSD